MCRGRRRSKNCDDRVVTEWWMDESIVAGTKYSVAPLQVTAVAVTGLRKKERGLVADLAVNQTMRSYGGGTRTNLLW